VWVVPTFGFDKEKNEFTVEYAQKGVDGFTLPDNKQNHVAEWLVALHEATGKAVYRERAEKWWKVQKARLKTRNDKFLVWNYWEPAGPWDYKADGKTPKHWVGVHPKGGYYAIDSAGMVAAYEAGLVFTKEDIDKLIATNKEMWNKDRKNPKFVAIDHKPGDAKQERYGALWSALVPYDKELQTLFESTHKPDSWGGLAGTPMHIARAKL
jgi:hypothetical protein